MVGGVPKVKRWYPIGGVKDEESCDARFCTFQIYPRMKKPTNACWLQ